MKKYLISLGFIFLLVGSLFAQCKNSFFPSKKGIKFEMTNYTPTGKEIGVTKNEVIEASSGKITVKTMDEESSLGGTYTITCDGGVARFNFGEMISKGSGLQIEDAEIKVEGGELSIPNDLSVGKKLDNSKGKMIVSAQGMTMEMDFSIVERAVEKRENIKTPSGNYNTYKLIQKVESSVEMMGNKQTSTTKSVMWLAKGVGIVKMETYLSGDKLISTQILTKFSKN